jgi:hypothetical protein
MTTDLTSVVDLNHVSNHSFCNVTCSSTTTIYRSDIICYLDLIQLIHTKVIVSIGGNDDKAVSDGSLVDEPWQDVQ